MKHTLMKLLVLGIGFAAFSHAQERTWTSEDGKSITGEMLRQEGGEIVLKVNGKEFRVSLARLSEKDREWIDARAGEQEAERKELSALAGTTRSFDKAEGQKVAFHVYYPSSFGQGDPRPMLILFSPGGGGKGILQQFKDSCESLGWIGVGCDTFSNRGTSEELDPLFEELLPVIEKNLPHDPERLYAGGFSGGASRALHYTAKFDRPWKGVVSCGGWLGKEYELKYRKGMAVAWVNGEKDKNANAWIAKDNEALGSRRCKTKVFHFPGGHEIGPPAVLTEAMKWIAETAR